MAGPRADDPLLTVDEVADRLSCSAKTVRREIAAGHLACTRIGPAGRLVRVAETDLAVYLARRNR